MEWMTQRMHPCTDRREKQGPMDASLEGLYQGAPQGALAGCRPHGAESGTRNTAVAKRMDAPTCFDKGNLMVTLYFLQ